MSYYLHIQIPGLPKRTNNQSFNNWKARYGESKKWKTKTLKAIIGNIPTKPLPQAKLHLIRNSSREPDFDGLVSSFKHVIDALVQYGIIIDDKPSVIGIPIYEWKRAPQSKGFIEVIIAE